MSSHAEGSTKAMFCALGANGGDRVGKVQRGASFTGSGAMLAEAIHSLTDCTNQVFLLTGMKEAKKPADESHPMGYGRVVYFWAMMVALLLFFLGGAFSVIDGINPQLRGRQRRCQLAGRRAGVLQWPYEHADRRRPAIL